VFAPCHRGAVTVVVLPTAAPAVVRGWATRVAPGPTCGFTMPDETVPAPVHPAVLRWEAMKARMTDAERNGWSFWESMARRMFAGPPEDRSRFKKARRKKGATDDSAE